MSLFRLGLLERLGPVGADQAGVLRRHDEVGAGGAGQPCLFAHEGHVLGHLVADVGLDQAGLERGHGDQPGGHPCLREGGLPRVRPPGSLPSLWKHTRRCRLHGSAGQRVCEPGASAGVRSRSAAQCLRC